MNGLYDLPGLVGGLAGTSLFLVGLAIAIPAAVRIPLARRRPDRGRLARGFVSAGAVVSTAGVVVFWGAQATQQARAFDRAAPFLGLSAVVLAALVGWRVARRGPAAPAERPPPPPSAEPRG